MRSRAASAVMVRLANCGPSPSWRSRLSLRRNAYLVRQVLEKALFLGREAFLSGARPQDQKANGFSPVGKRQAERVVYGISRGRRVLEPSPAP